MDGTASPIDSTDLEYLEWIEDTQLDNGIRLAWLAFEYAWNGR